MNLFVVGVVIERLGQDVYGLIYVVLATGYLDANARAAQQGAHGSGFGSGRRAVTSKLREQFARLRLELRVLALGEQGTRFALKLSHLAGRGTRRQVFDQTA